MPSYTLAQLATQALRDIGCLRPGQSAANNAALLAEVLDVGNQRLDLWTIDNFIVYSYPAALYTLTAGQQSYQIGPGQAAPNFNAARPTGIADANIVLNTVTPVVRTPLDLIDKDRWAAIAVQDIPFAIPLELYYDDGFDLTSGFATLNLWPGPLASYQLELFTTQTMPFASFVNATTAYSFPPGYAFLMRKQLAMDLVPMMDISAKTYRLEQPRAPMVAIVKNQLREAREIIEANNGPAPTLPGDPAFGGGAKGGWNYALGISGRSNR